jgi:hypothetical protein
MTWQPRQISHPDLTKLTSFCSPKTSSFNRHLWASKTGYLTQREKDVIVAKPSLGREG